MQSLRYPHQIDSVIRWLLYLHPPNNVVAFLLDAIAKIIDAIPITELNHDLHWRDSGYWGVRSRINGFVKGWITFARSYQSLADLDQQVRWWHLVRWANCVGHPYGETTTLWDVFNAYQAGGATEADVMFYLLGAEERIVEGDQTSGTAEAKAILEPHFRICRIDAP
jgi:hypothetical protein